MLEESDQQSHKINTISLTKVAEQITGIVLTETECYTICNMGLQLHSVQTFVMSNFMRVREANLLLVLVPGKVNRRQRLSGNAI